MYPQIFNVNILICFEDIYKGQKHLFWTSVKLYEECEISRFGVRNNFMLKMVAILDFEPLNGE